MFVSPSGRLARDLSAIRLATTVNATFRRMSRSNELHVPRSRPSARSGGAAAQAQLIAFLPKARGRRLFLTGSSASIAKLSVRAVARTASRHC
jgi:hypothetical protein